MLSMVVTFSVFGLNRHLKSVDIGLMVTFRIACIEFGFVNCIATTWQTKALARFCCKTDGGGWRITTIEVALPKHMEEAMKLHSYRRFNIISAKLFRGWAVTCIKYRQPALSTRPFASKSVHRLCKKYGVSA
jgi:hypothetical protein